MQLRKRQWVWFWNDKEWKRGRIVTVNRRALTVRDRNKKLHRVYYWVVASSTKPTMDYVDYRNDEYANRGHTDVQTRYRLLQKLGVKPR